MLYFGSYDRAFDQGCGIYFHDDDGAELQYPYKQIYQPAFWTIPAKKANTE